MVSLANCLFFTLSWLFIYIWIDELNVRNDQMDDNNFKNSLCITSTLQWNRNSVDRSRPMGLLFISNVGWFGGMLFLHFMLFPTFLEKNILGIKKNKSQNFLIFLEILKKWMTTIFKTHYASLQWNRNSVDWSRPMGLLFISNVGVVWGGCFSYILCYFQHF